MLDLKTTTFEDIIGRLKAYEERICDEEETPEEQNKLMYTNSEQQYNRCYGGEKEAVVVDVDSIEEEALVVTIMVEKSEMHRE